MKNKKIIISISIMLFIIALTALLIKPIIKNINYVLDLKGVFEVLYLVENLEY